MEELTNPVNDQMHKLNNTKEGARSHFCKHLTYSSITKELIEKLKLFLIDEFNNFDNNGFKMVLKPLQNSVSNRFENDVLVSYSIRCSGIINEEFYHFENREAITFNKDGFIGFAGWADRTNIVPIITAFNKWVDFIITDKNLSIHEH